MPWRSIFGRDIGEDQRPAERSNRLFQRIRLIDEIPVGEHHIDAQVGGVGAQHLQVRLRGEVVGLPRLRREVQRDERRARVVSSARASSGTFRCGSTLVNHDPGPNTTQSASSTARSASGQAGGSAGTSEMLST